MLPRRVVALALTSALIIACNNNENKQQPPAPPASTVAVTPPPPPSASAAPEAAPIEVEIASVADTMAFDKTTLTFPANARVHLVFKNNAKSDVLAHNWVLVNEKTEAKVAAAGLAAGVAAGYLPASDDDVLASTPLAQPGKTSEVTFRAPKKPGTYPYICTFPGHYLMMKGVLTVTAPTS